MHFITTLDRYANGAEGPGDRAAARTMAAYELIEMEAMADRAVARADRSVAAVETLDTELRSLHAEVGETYDPAASPQRPDVAARAPRRR
ncbi:MAG TPA: hypothetical protein VML75_26710 [Kofleriaceae bacterium]|nr:hypothetical protein [Kofleriaceae bacterium]